MVRQRAPFGGSQKLADPQHHVAGIGAPPPLAPLVELLGKICGRLSAERRIGRAEALSAVSVAAGARRQAACGIAADVQHRGIGGGGGARPVGQRRIIGGHRASAAGVDFAGDVTHLRVSATTVGIGVELTMKVAGVETGQSRRVGAVAAAIEAMAGKAGVGSARLSAADRDDPAVGFEPVDRPGRGVDAAACEHGAGGAKRPDAGGGHTVTRTARAQRRFRVAGLIPLALLAGACKPPPEPRQEMPQASAARGREAIERAGCGACHIIPGIGWPRGKVGPGLDGLAERALIAGRLPNRPDVLAAYVRNAPALVPNSAMPAMPITVEEARDIAAYLYEQGAR